MVIQSDGLAHLQTLLRKLHKTLQETIAGNHTDWQRVAIHYDGILGSERVVSRREDIVDAT